MSTSTAARPGGGGGPRPSAAAATGTGPTRGTAPPRAGAGRSGPVAGAAWPALGTALSVAAAGGAVLALGNLLEPGGWRGGAWVALVLLGALVAGVRAVLGARSPWVPDLVGLGALVLAVVVARGGVDGGAGLPTPAAVGRAVDVALEGVRAIQVGVVPLRGTTGSDLLVVGGACLVLLLVDALAVAARTPALAGVPLLLLWVPTVTLGVAAPGSALWAAGLPWLLLLAWDRGREDRRVPGGARAAARRRAGPATVSALVVVALAAIATPLAAGGLATLPAWSRLELPDLGLEPVGPLTLSDELDLRESLGSRSAQEVMRYSLSVLDAGDDPPPTDLAAAVGPLRAFTLAEFDGRSWRRTEASGLEDVPDSVFGGDRGTTVPTDAVVRVAVEVRQLDETRLPIATTQRALQAPEQWRYDVARDEVIGGRPTRDGLRYEMTVRVPELRAEDLAQVAVAPPPGATEDYLQLPATARLEDVRALAAEITRDAASPFEQAAALQTWFRSAANFTYDTRVSTATSDDAVWDFLQSQRGYCVQFATAMAVMSRTLGIPARVGVGFLPGAEVGTSTRSVTGQQAHAWPELYFPGYGWVRFEPTPAVQTGTAPVWTTPPAAGADGPPPEDEVPATAAPGAGASASAAPTTGPSASASAGPGTGRAAGGTSWVPPLVVLLTLLVGAGAAALVRRARVPVPRDPDESWERLRSDLARRSIAWPGSATPRAAPAEVERTVLGRAGRPLPEAAGAALRTLAAGVERHRYSPGLATAADPDELARLRDVVLAGVDEAVRRRGGTTDGGTTGDGTTGATPTSVPAGSASS
ncbi:transglutaminaseTgpA domain-containing protein [Cellulomonas endophytica]|uniref:transglutaminase family protein n=1 Tax=Cellulomonas endophytica TaxID=2494735 RepID=UPI001011F78D|nr:DUF3488 and transglutaminase-like domain-containing protein [Cellulomonas endophytica]